MRKGINKIGIRILVIFLLISGLFMLHGFSINKEEMIKNALNQRGIYHWRIVSEVEEDDEGLIFFEFNHEINAFYYQRMGWYYKADLSTTYDISLNRGSSYYKSRETSYTLGTQTFLVNRDASQATLYFRSEDEKGATLESLKSLELLAPGIFIVDSGLFGDQCLYYFYNDQGEVIDVQSSQPFEVLLSQLHVSENKTINAGWLENYLISGINQKENVSQELANQFKSEAIATYQYTQPFASASPQRWIAMESSYIETIWISSVKEKDYILWCEGELAFDEVLFNVYIERLLEQALAPNTISFQIDGYSYLKLIDFFETFASSHQ